MHFRSLIPEDVDCIVLLEEGELSAWSSGDVHREISQPHGIQQVAVDEESGEILGWCCCRYLENEAELLRIAVLGSQRRRKVGSALFVHLCRQLTDAGVKSLFLEVRSRNLPALRFYRRHEFSEIGRRRKYYSFPEDDALVLMKDLAAR